jgi:O-antigen ligase
MPFATNTRRAAPAPAFYWLLPPSVLLFVLPLAHTAALRSLALLATLLTTLAYAHRQPVPRLPLLPAFALWAAAGLLTLPWALDVAFSLDAWKTDVLYSLLVFAAFHTLSADLAAFAWLRRVATASLLFTSTLAVISNLKYGYWAIGMHNALGEYSTFVVTTLPLLLTVYFPGALRGAAWERWLATSALAVAGYAALLTRSRGLWLALACIGIAAIAWAARRTRLPRGLALTAAVGVLLAALAAAAVVSSQRNTSLTSLHDRDRIYSVAFEQFLERPLTGHGYGREANREVYKEAFPGMLLRHAHNVVLSYAEQMGVLGLAVLLAIFGGLLTRFRRLAGAADDGTALLGATGLILCAVVLLKNMTDMFFYGHCLLLFWAHCGILLGYGSRQRLGTMA